MPLAGTSSFLYDTYQCTHLLLLSFLTTPLCLTWGCCCCRGREAAASDEQQLRTPDDGRIASLTTVSLVTRINSLLYIEENLPAMEKIVQDR